MDSTKSNVPLALAALAVVVVILAVLLMMERPPAAIASVKIALGLQRDSVKSANGTKPICSQIIVPAGDCIPQHLANLPPDPGPEGMKTIEGIDSDKDGVRDDVQRFIAEKWGHSERAVRALTSVAKSVQQTVLLGDSVSREEARKLTNETINKSVDCFVWSVEDKIRQADAAVRVVAAVANTPARYERKDKFDALLANMVFQASDAPVKELCGYDPATLAN